MMGVGTDPPPFGTGGLSKLQEMVKGREVTQQSTGRQGQPRCKVARCKMQDARSPRCDWVTKYRPGGNCKSAVGLSLGGGWSEPALLISISPSRASSSMPPQGMVA